MEIESDSAIPFLDILVITKETSLTTKVYRKHVNTGGHLKFDSNHPPNAKRGLIQRRHKRLQPYAKKAKIDIMKLVASDAIFS
jgi:hypothetical protein